MIFSEHLTLWTYVEIVVYIAIYRKVFDVIARNVDRPQFLQKWDLNRGTAVGIANLIVSALFGFGASLSGLGILGHSLRRTGPVENGELRNGMDFFAKTIY